MKKFLILMIFTAVLFMTGCGNDSNTDKKLTCSFTIPDSKVALVPGEKFDSTADLLKETISYTEGASCYYDGMDKNFGYNGYTVVTYPAADGDYISEIYVTSSDIKTPEGITVGSKADDVIKAYGNDYVLDGKMYKYNMDDGRYVYFYMSNDVVKTYGFAKEIK